MDIRLIFRNYYWFINERTHSSIFRALLDWRRDIEEVRQANPFDTTPRYFWNFNVSWENEIKQGAGKIFYTLTQVRGPMVSVLKPTQVDWASSLR